MELKKVITSKTVYALSSAGALLLFPNVINLYPYEIIVFVLLTDQTLLYHMYKIIIGLIM